ncbi:MAG: DNA repair protein RadC [Dysgonamonadaceae bacterium]|jgi:DNA repair protein RadC|nr:DNA repair protein RadC [Dysgonamonadaceae bacterium]
MEETNVKLRIKNWAKEDRPREKLLYKGVNALTDAELLAIIIGSGSKEETVVELSQRILQTTDNNINQLGKLSVNQLISGFKGIGEAKAVGIVAALELGKRRKISEIAEKKTITCSIDIYNYFHPLLCDLGYEEFWVLLLNRSNRIIDKIKISQGGVSGTHVDSKLIYKEAISRLASNVIICHNHPSGNNHPSAQDDEITTKIKNGAKLLDMSLLDHIIICDGNYYSYADAGRFND